MPQDKYLGGMLRMLILSELSLGPGYGYGMAKAIGSKSGGDLAVRPESLYPVLHRMENEGLVTARWEQSGSGRPRKFYSMTPKGTRRWQRSLARFISQSRGALKVVSGEPAEEAR